MENIIKKILEIDQDACERLELAEKQKKQILNDAKLEELKIKEEHIQHADLRITKYEESEKETAGLKINEIELKKHEKINKLQVIYDSNHTSWEQDIFQRIVGE